MNKFLPSLLALLLATVISFAETQPEEKSATKEATEAAVVIVKSRHR